MPEKQKAIGLGQKENILRGVAIGFAAVAVVSCTKLDTDNRHARAIEVVRVLSADDMEGRRTGTEGNLAARMYLIEQLDALGVEKPLGRYESEFSFERTITEDISKKYTGVNLVSAISGSMNTEATQRPAVVITAHYDHLGTQGGQIYNGADDNASGVGALLAVIEDFKENPPPHDTVFVLFDAEEMGLQGARAFVQEPDTLPQYCFSFNVNLDMVSRNDKNELYVAGAFHSPGLKPLFDEIASASTVKLLQGHDRPEDGAQDWTLQSDHGPFHRTGIPFAYFGVEDHAHYHQPTDDFDTIPLEFYSRAIDTIILSSRLINQKLTSLGRNCTE